MSDFKRFQQRPDVPSGQNIAKTGLAVKRSLGEMKIIADIVSGEKKLPPSADKYKLLYRGSHLYDFYLLVEDCLLHLARTFDKWVPASPDWRGRLIKLMQYPVPGRRPPVLSAETASLLEDYLCLFLNFHHQCSTLSSSRIQKMIDNISLLYIRLEKEFAFITRQINF